MALVAEWQSGANVAPKAEGIPVAPRSHFDLKKLQLLHKNLTSNRSDKQSAIGDEADGLNEDLGNLNFLQNFNKTTIVKPVSSATPMKILQDGGFLNNNSPISLRKILLETPKKGGKKEGVQKVSNTKSVIGSGNIVCLERNGNTVEINMEAVCSRMMEIGSDSDEEICDSVLLEETVHSCEDDVGENPVMENPAVGNSNKENFLGNSNKENSSLGNLVPKVEKDEIKQDKKVKIGSIKEEFDEELTDLKWLQDINLLKNIKTGDWSMCRSPPTNQHLDSTNDAFDHEMLPNSTRAYSCLTKGSYNPFRHASTKPPYSFSCLIFMAIEDSSEKKLPVKEIYRWVQNSFPFYRNAPTGWKNSVRHNLSLNKCFMKVDKDRGEGIGKGSYWCVHPHYRPNLLQALRRTPYHPFHQMQMISGGGGVNSSSLQQLSPSSSGLQSAGSDMDDIEIPIPDTTDIDVAHTLMQMRLEARRADLAARIARVAAGLDGAVESSSVRAALSLAALLEGLEEHDDRTMLYEKLRHTHRDGDDPACTPHPSTDHNYSVTDDVIQAALLISPASSIDHDYDFYNDDDDDDDYDDDFFHNNEPIDLTKKKKPEILSRNSRAGKSRGEKLGKPQNSRHLKKGNRKQKLSIAVKKPVSKKASRKTMPGVRRGISWDGEVLKSPGKSPKKADVESSDAEALDGAGALLQLCLNAAGNSQREAPGGENPPRKKRLTVRERERQVRERAAELEDIRDEVDFIRSCTRGVSPHKSGDSVGTSGEKVGKGGDNVKKSRDKAGRTAGSGDRKGKRREIEDDDDDSTQATYGSCSSSYVEEVVTRTRSGGEGSTKRRPKPNEKFREFFATKAKKSKLDTEEACSGTGKQHGKKFGSSTSADKKALGKSSEKSKNKKKKDLINGKKGGAFGSDSTGAEVKMECDYQEGEIIGEIKIELKEEPMG